MAEFVGDNDTKIVHKNEPASQRCVEADSIGPGNKVFFATLAEAHGGGFRDCPVCLGGSDPIAT